MQKGLYSMIQKEQERGSEFRKWDLHIHSPYTVLNNNFGLSDGKGNVDIDKFIKKNKG